MLLDYTVVLSTWNQALIWLSILVAKYTRWMHGLSTSEWWPVFICFAILLLPKESLICLKCCWSVKWEPSRFDVYKWPDGLVNKASISDVARIAWGMTMSVTLKHEARSRKSHGISCGASVNLRVLHNLSHGFPHSKDRVVFIMQTFRMISALFLNLLSILQKLNKNIFLHPC